MPRKSATPKPVEIDRVRVPIILAIFVVAGIGLTVGAIMWGRSDTGVIDVSATIANSQYNSDQREQGGTPTLAPSQAFVDMPNGGLVPQGSEGTPPPPPPTEEETASTTTKGEEGDGATEATDPEGSVGEATRDAEVESRETAESESSQSSGDASI